MILSRPTGSYEVVLPKVPSDPTSVVYTISNTEPPRSTLNFQQIPSGIEQLQPQHNPSPESIIRSNLGMLVYTTKDINNSYLQYGNQLFYAGQVVEFSDQIASVIVPVDSAVETQHDQHYVDPVSVGLTQSVMDDVASEAVATQKKILSELDLYQANQAMYKSNIVSQQRIINETNRIISGIDAILLKNPTAEMQQVKAQMQAGKIAAEAIILDNTNKLDELNTLIQGAKGQLTALAVLID